MYKGSDCHGKRLWGEVIYLLKSKQGIVMSLLLPGDGDRRHIKENIFDQISIEYLKTGGG